MEFQIEKDLLEGFALLELETAHLPLTVRAVKGERLGFTVQGGEAVIYYPQKHLFYRELALLAAHGTAETAQFESTDFETLSVMIDTSRGAVQTVETVCRFLNKLAVLGYGTVLLYTEDTVALETRPYFGYMRGRYTPEELRAMDDYAHKLGIELVPCIECYGHMEK